MAIRLLLLGPATKRRKPMAEKTFVRSFREFLLVLQDRNIKPPAFIALASKEEAIKIVIELQTEEAEQQTAPAYQSALDSIRAGVLHSFLLLGVEFCWPADPALERERGSLRAVA